MHPSPPRLLTVATAILILLAPPRASAQSPAGDPLPAQEPVRTVSLAEAVRLSLEADPASVAAEADLEVAQSELLQARGLFLPSLSLNSAFNSSSNERFDQSTGRLVSESYTAQAQVGYDIFTGGRRFAEQRVAAAGVHAAEASFRAQRFQTVLATTESFYGAAAAAELEGVARQRLDRARQQLEFARTRLEVGSATRSDVLRAELEVGNAELAVLDAETSTRATRLALGRRIGLMEPVAPAAAALPEEAPPLPEIPDLVARAERSSPAAVAARATLRGVRAERWTAFSSYLPTLRATAGYDWFSFDFPPNQRSWSLRLLASWPIFNGFQREAALTRASAATRVAEARAEDVLIATRVAVEVAAREVESAERRVAIAERGVELAREDLRVQEERYRIGAATILDLQSSQLALADAQVAHVRARQTLGVALATLEAELGANLDGVGGVERGDD